MIIVGVFLEQFLCDDVAVLQLAKCPRMKDSVRTTLEESKKLKEHCAKWDKEEWQKSSLRRQQGRGAQALLLDVALQDLKNAVEGVGMPDSLIFIGHNDGGVDELVRSQLQPVVFAVRAGLDTTSCDKFCLASVRLLLQGSRTVVAAPITDVKVTGCVNLGSSTSQVFSPSSRVFFSVIKRKCCLCAEPVFVRCPLTQGFLAGEG